MISRGSKYSEACKVFRMIEVLGVVYDFPRLDVFGSLQDIRWSVELGIVRDFPKETKSCSLPFLPGR